MKTIQNIFSASLKENNNSSLFEEISELTFELSKKKIQRLKDEKKIQIRLGELFEMFCRVLQNEKLDNVDNIDAVITGLIKAATYDKEEFLYKTIYEKEQLEKSIEREKRNIQKSIIGTLDILENHIEKMDDNISKESIKALQSTKLRGIEMLGILKETTSEAILTTLEHAKDIEDTVFEITKNITYQTINEGPLTKSRIMDITSSVLGVAIEIADEDQGNAKSLLNGAIHGTKEGIAKSIDKFKNDLKFAPEELADHDLKAVKRDLIKVEENFIDVVKKTLAKSDGISHEIMENIIENDINSSLAKIKRVATETSEMLSEKIDELNISENEFVKKAEKKIEEFEKIASEKFESIKKDERTQNITKEAKRLGTRAWEVAMNALKGAKEAINKQK